MWKASLSSNASTRSLEQLDKKAPVAVRVNPDVDAKTHKYISTGKSRNKFGIGLDRAAEVYARAAELSHLQLRGLQTHIGSQILDSQPFRRGRGEARSIGEVFARSI